MEFLPNSGYFFTVGDDSHHGVDRLREADSPWHSLMLVYYLNGDAGTANGRKCLREPRMGTNGHEWARRESGKGGPLISADGR